MVGSREVLPISKGTDPLLHNEKSQRASPYCIMDLKQKQECCGDCETSQKSDTQQLCFTLATSRKSCCPPEKNRNLRQTHSDLQFSFPRGYGESSNWRSQDQGLSTSRTLATALTQSFSCKLDFICVCRKPDLPPMH